MKPNFSTKNSLLWGVIALIIGLVIAFNPVDAVKFSIQLCGTLLLIIGTTNLISFLVLKHKNNLSWSAIPLGSVLSFLFGLLLMISPLTFVAFWGYLIGAVMAALGIMQLISFTRLKKAGAVIKPLNYLFSIVMVAMGIVVMLFPINANAWVMIFAGLWIAAFGLSEILNYFIINVPLKAQQKSHSELK